MNYELNYGRVRSKPSRVGEMKQVSDGGLGGDHVAVPGYSLDDIEA